MACKLMLRWAAAVVAVVTLLTPAGHTRADDRPNVIIIMLDDMGWSDLGFYGGEVQTPHIDRLAANGLRFTQFYNTGRCCPTRASLLTGLYPHQAGVGQMTFDTNLPGYRGFLQPHCVTIAEVLRDAGYRTAMVGKWHLSLTGQHGDHMKHLNNQVIRDTFSDVSTYPVNRGFDRHYGVIWGVVNFFDPFSLVRDAEPVRKVPDDYYITDALNEHAVKYVKDMSAGDKPFFLYLAHTAPHWPLHARPQDIANYKDTYTPGWQAIRRARYDRQVQMGLIDPATTPLSERFPGEPDWPENDTQVWDARAMAVHAAMIDRVDQGVGQLIDTLREAGELDNTLIFVLSDNGASPENPGRPGFDRVSETRQGQAIRYYPRDADKTPATLPGAENTYAGIERHWANVANTPLRYWKATQHEGGVRTPLVVHWPAGLKADAGSITKQPGHVIDLMATCADVAKAKYPAKRGGHDIKPLEGKSLRPVLEGRQRDGHDAIYFEHFGARAVRQGDWKLVAPPRGAWELYNLAADGSETNNLAAEMPEKVRALERLWRQWAERANVFPSPSADAFGPSAGGDDAHIGSDKRTFRLNAGDRLAREQAPAIAGRSIAIDAVIATQGKDGVIVAQGGDQAGFSLFVKDGRLGFATRVGGKQTVALSPKPLPAEGKSKIGADLKADGTLVVRIGEASVASEKSPGLIPVQPIDELEVGQDSRTTVGPYGGDNAFGGEIEGIEIRLGERSSAVDRLERTVAQLRPASKKAAQPNIVLILSDDQGWTGSSVAMHDAVPASRSDYYRTPALDRLAREGMRFSNAYAPHPNCSPTRLSIQTGMSPAAVGMTDIIGRNSGPFYEGNRLIPPRHINAIPHERTTIAEWLKSAAPDYATGHFGKWHLAGGGPGEHGYDEHDGAAGNPGTSASADDDPKRIFSITDHAIDFIARQAAAGRPFFCQVSHHAVHLPIEARPQTIALCESRERGERHDHAPHAAMTQDMDRGIGLLLEALDRLGLAESTYVIFTSDNGSYLKSGDERVSSNAPLRGQKAQVWEGGIRVPMIVRGPDVKAGSISHTPVIGYDIFPTVRELIGVAAALPDGVEGGSFAAVLKNAGNGEVRRPRDGIVWHFPHYQHQKGTTPQSAIRVGDFKLVKLYESEEAMLFNLADDIAESRDLSAKMPERAAAMHKQMIDYLASINAGVPRVNPAFHKADGPAATR